MNFAAIGIAASNALTMGQDIAKTIADTDKAIKQASEGCFTSGNVAVAKIRELVAAHRKFKLQVVSLSSVDLCVPADISQSIAKVDAMLLVARLITQDALIDNAVGALVHRFGRMRRCW